VIGVIRLVVISCLWLIVCTCWCKVFNSEVTEPLHEDREFS
jgi:hypothetical protein